MLVQKHAFLSIVHPYVARTIDTLRNKNNDMMRSKKMKTNHWKLYAPSSLSHMLPILRFFSRSCALFPWIGNWKIVWNLFTMRNDVIFSTHNDRAHALSLSGCQWASKHLYVLLRLGSVSNASMHAINGVYVSLSLAFGHFSQYFQHFPRTLGWTFSTLSVCLFRRVCVCLWYTHRCDVMWWENLQMDDDSVQQRLSIGSVRLSNLVSIALNCFIKFIP